MLEQLLQSRWLRKATLVGSTILSLTSCTRVYETQYVDRPVAVDATNEPGENDDMSPDSAENDSTEYTSPLSIVTDSFGQQCDQKELKTFFKDKDGDQYGVKEENVFACSRPSGYVEFNGFLDCDDYSTIIKPGAMEFCDGKDNNCNGLTDEGLTQAQSCGISDVGSCKTGVEQKYCVDGGWTTWLGCNAILPSAETCDEKDNDCNGIIDDGFDLGELCAEAVGWCSGKAYRECTEDTLSTFCNDVEEEVCCEPAGSKKNAIPCEPYSFVFVLDYTQSMEDDFDEAKQLTLDFAKAISTAKSGVELGLIIFNDKVKNYGFAADYAQFEQWLMPIMANGGDDEPEAQLPAVVSALDLDWTSGKEKYILLLTDAPFHKEDSVSKYSIADVKSLIQAAGAYVIGIEYDGANADLQDLVEGNGKLYPISNLPEIEGLFNQFLEEKNDSWDECLPDGSWTKKYGSCSGPK